MKNLLVSTALLVATTASSAFAIDYNARQSRVAEAIANDLGVSSQVWRGQIGWARNIVRQRLADKYAEGVASAQSTIDGLNADLATANAGLGAAQRRGEADAISYVSEELADSGIVVDHTDSDLLVQDIVASVSAARLAGIASVDITTDNAAAIEAAKAGARAGKAAHVAIANIVSGRELAAFEATGVQQNNSTFNFANYDNADYNSNVTGTQLNAIGNIAAGELFVDADGNTHTSISLTVNGETRLYNTQAVGSSATVDNAIAAAGFRIAISDDIDAVIEEAIDDAHAAGYSEGYADGYKDGYSDGFDAGVRSVN